MQPSTESPVVQTSLGAVRGALLPPASPSSTTTVARFLGIPYAAPPTGANRFAPPQPPQPWDELDASAFGPPSPQRAYTGVLKTIVPPVPGVDQGAPAEGAREWDMDFLKINVWAPAHCLPSPPSSPSRPHSQDLPSSSPSLSPSHPNAPPLPSLSAPNGSGLPVLLWIHGGALERGSSSQPLSDGSSFASQNIIFASFNYRLGTEGFVLPNLGLQDAAAALRWVYTEIGAFGGDPKRITLMGESAGGALVAALCSMAGGMVAGAIVQSAPLEIKPSLGRGAAEGVLRRLRRGRGREELGGVGVEELLEARAEEVRRRGDSPLSGAPGFELVLDPSSPSQGREGGALLAQSPHTALVDASIPILIGTTTDEYRLWFGHELSSIGWFKLHAAAWWLGVPRAAISALWRHFPEAGYGEVFGQLVTDMFLRKPADELARARAQRASVGEARRKGSATEGKVGKPSGEQYEDERGRDTRQDDGREDGGKQADAREEGKGQTWVYEFASPSPLHSLGAAHAVELPFVFNTLRSPDGRAWVGEDAPQELADEMHSAWVRFVKTGSPGWEAYGEGRRVRVFGEGGGAEEGGAGDLGEGEGVGGEGGEARTVRVRRADVLDSLPASSL